MADIELTPEQGEIRDFQDGALLVEAGPGSGKTRVLTERVRRLIKDSSGNYRVLAVTFTNKAAAEMKERLVGSVPDLDNRAFIGTLHSFCHEVLRDRGEPVGFETEPIVFESREDQRRVLLEAVREDPILAGEIDQLSQKAREEQINTWLTQISEAKRDLKRPSDLRESNPKLAAAYESYNSGLQAAGALDFDDLLYYTYRLFSENPNVRRFYHRLYRFLCIDEAQDLNRAQYEVIKAFCGENFDNVMMVGDPNQTIYSWAGASPEFLKEFAEDFGATRFQLDQNFRSSEEVVKAAARLKREIGPGRDEIQSHHPIKGEVSAIVTETQTDEARFVLQKARELIDQGHPEIESSIAWGDIGVLARNTYALANLEDLLEEEEVPFQRKTSKEDMYRSQLGEEMDLLFRVFANPRDSLHAGELIESWDVDLPMEAEPRYSPSGLLEKLEGTADLPLRAQAEIEAVRECDGPYSNFNLKRGLDYLASILQGSEVIDTPSAREDLDFLRREWDRFLRSSTGNRQSLPAFLAYSGSSYQVSEDEMSLLTVHSAKGLEFQTVFLVGFVEGLFPDYRADTRAEMDEERRSAYVALTRAKRVCFITAPRYRRMPWGDVEGQEPSRFISEMGLELKET